MILWRLLREHCPTSSVRSVYQEDNGNLWMGIMGIRSGIL